MKGLFLRLIGVLVFVLAVVGGATVGLAVIDRKPPITYEAGRALATSVPQGGTIEVEFTVFRTRICEGDAERWVTDSIGIRHAIHSFTVSGQPPQLAGRETYVRKITLPDALPLGPASYQVTITYSCNVFHRLGWPIIVKSPAVLFEVTPRASLLVLPPLGSLPDGGDG